MLEAMGSLVSNRRVSTAISFDDFEEVTCDLCGYLATKRRSTGKVICLKCEEREMVERVIAENEQLKRQKPFRLFDSNSLLTPNLRDATFENYYPTTLDLGRAKEKMSHFAETFVPGSGENILLTGPCGVGKSHLGAAVTKALIKKGHSCLFINVPKLLSKIRATYNRDPEVTEEQWLVLLETVDLLVLDDIGAEYRGNHDAESWAVKKLFEIIDSRQGKSTIFTTNYNSDELTKHLGSRNVSRMMNGTNVLRMPGPDYRLRNLGGGQGA